MPSLESSADTKYQHQLPTVSYRMITDDKSLLAPAGVHSEQARHFGYNDFSDFTRPDNYIRHIEPIESELAGQVEYDMDEQDKEWLDAVNAERRKEQSGTISYEIFEIIMDQLEKEWFQLVKRIPQPASHMPVEDSKCAICDDGEGENLNAIVFCDGCNLAVHQDCYGVPYIPEGQWLCRKCTVSPENPVSCLFCPSEGGAFKQTTTGHWAHLLCALWIPELGLGNAMYMEPIEGAETVPKSRWKLVCSLCRERVGACIQCDNKTCFTAFHVTCARQYGLLDSMKSMSPGGYIRGFCEKHLPGGRRTSGAEENAGPRAVTTKTARAHAKSYRPEPPIVPHMIVQKLLDYISRLSIRKRQPFVERLCRYWSLKREARRGAPLLKRLYLEPWTANSASRQESDAEKAKKLEFMTMLRTDLEKVRMLAELARKREKEKLRQAQLIKDVVESFLFPYYGQLVVAFERIASMDKGELFMHPVNRAEVPDYYDVVKEPMCWLQIEEKLDKNAYTQIADFKRDVMLVLDNAMLYNAAETTFHRTAKRIRANCQQVLDDLNPLSDEGVGDLEPALAVLDAMLASSASNAEVDNLASIFNFEMEPPKEPTPPPPTPPPPRKRDRRDAETRKKQWEERERRAKEREPARATRAAQAATQAFVAEAGVAAESPSTPQVLPKELAVSARDRRRSSRQVKADGTESQAQDDHLARQRRPQVGVAGIETIPVLTDRQRRERERALDITTKDVGAQDQFERFNVGWVLPEGSKRRRVEVPPSKSSNGNADKRSSAAPSTGRKEPVPLPAEVPPSSPLSDIDSSGELTPVASDAEADEAMATPVAGPSRRDRSSRKSRASGTTRSTRKSEAKAEPDTVVQVEGLLASRRGRNVPPVIDTTTPSKPSGRSAGRASRGARPSGVTAADTSDGELTPLLDTPKVSGRSKRKTPDNDDDAMDVDAGEVQEEQIEVEEEPFEVIEAQEEGDQIEVQEAEGSEEVDEEDEEEDPFPDCTLVWAKTSGFPVWPGVIADPEDEDVPPVVLSNKDRYPANGEKTWLVKFFDKQSTFGWITRNHLDWLAADNDVDARYLAGKGIGRSGSFKTPKLKTACAKAYREALASIEEEEGEGGDEDMETE